MFWRCSVLMFWADYWQRKCRRTQVGSRGCDASRDNRWWLMLFWVKMKTTLIWAIIISDRLHVAPVAVERTCQAQQSIHNYSNWIINQEAIDAGGPDYSCAHAKSRVAMLRPILLMNELFKSGIFYLYITVKMAFTAIYFSFDIDNSVFKVILIISLSRNYETIHSAIITTHRDTHINTGLSGLSWFHVMTLGKYSEICRPIKKNKKNKSHFIYSWLIWIFRVSIDQQQLKNKPDQRFKHTCLTSLIFTFSAS